MQHCAKQIPENVSQWEARLVFPPLEEMVEFLRAAPSLPTMLLCLRGEDVSLPGAELVVVHLGGCYSGRTVIHRVAGVLSTAKIAQVVQRFFS